jgi:hypothetical protein
VAVRGTAYKCKVSSSHDSSMLLDSESLSFMGRKALTIVLPSNVDEFDWVMDDILGISSCFSTIISS